MSDARPAAGGAPAASELAQEPQPGLWRRYGWLIKHWLTFLLILGALMSINEWKSVWVNQHLSKFTAVIMAFLMNLIGVESKVRGLHVVCTICKFKIIGECTAFYPMCIYVASVLAFPSPWIRRLLGVLLGIPLILAINQVRLISLCYIARSFPDYFETIHIVVWQSLIILFTVLVWILWVSTLGRRA